MSSLEEAVEHIEAHSTHHSDAIVTENAEAAAYFTNQVDSAAVYVNAQRVSLMGASFGLGCEIGDFYSETARAWAYGLERVDQLQVCGYW